MAIKLARRFTLILGGARSGKSTLAQEMATRASTVLFVATAEALDDEMRNRINEHRRSRPGNWRTIEVPVRVGEVVIQEHRGEDLVLIDCITLLVSNLLTRNDPEAACERHVVAEVGGLIAAVDTLAADFIMVSNEVGLGLVPDNALGRTYRDMLGKVNQKLAARADEVFFLAAGLPLKIK